MTNIKSKTAKVVAGLVTALFVLVGASTASAAYNFDTNLKMGMTSPAVMELQKVLNMSADTQVAASGVGSSGMETSYFGGLSKTAVIKFQNKYASEILTPNGLTAGTGFVGASTRAKLSILSAGGTPPPQGGLPAGCTAAQPVQMFSPINGAPCVVGGTPQGTGPVTVSLAADNPASGYYAATQAGAPLMKMTFTGSGTVNTVVLKKIGVAADASYSNVYLFDGTTRLTDGASVSNSGLISFSSPSGLFTVNGSRTITVKVDLASGGSEVVGVALNSYTVAGQTAVAVTGVSGNQFSLVSASGLASIDLGATVLPAAGSIDPQNDYVVWQNTLSISSREAKLVSLALREVGSINLGDVNNFRLMIDGATVATTQSIDANNYVTLVPATPVTLSTNSHTLKVMADIVGGAYRNFKFEVRNKVDFNVIDGQSGYGISVPTADIPASAGVQTINQGNITVQKATGSPSGDVILNGNDVVLAKYTLRTFGEAVKIDTIKASVALSAYTTTASVDGLRSGRILIDGNQVGSTSTLSENSDGVGYTTYSTNYTLAAGSTATLEIRADLYDTGASAAVAASATIVANLEDVGAMLNAQGVTSGQTFDLPTSDVAGNTLTVRAGTVTLSKYNSYADQTTVAPSSSYLIGKWAITGGTVEDVNIDTFSFDNTYTDAFADADLNNVTLKVGGVQVGTPKSTVSSPFSFSGNVAIPKGTTKYVELYSDILTSATDGDATDDTVYSELTITGTTYPSGASVAPAAKNGQTITVNDGGSFSSGLGATPVDRAVSGNQVVVGAVYKFTATDESFLIKEIQVKVGSSDIASVISTVRLYDGATPLGEETPFDDTVANVSLSGLQAGGVPVAANTVKNITAKLTLNAIGQGAGISQSNAALSLDSVKYANSQGVETTDGTDRNGEDLYVYKAVPTLAQVQVSNGTVVNGANVDLFKFTITAPSASISANGISVKQIVLPVTWNDGGTQTPDVLEVESMKLYVDGSDVTTSDVTLQDEDGNSVESTSGLLADDSSLIISWDAGTELTIGAGESVEVKIRGTFQGFNAMDGDPNPTDSVGFSLNTDSAHNGSETYLNGTATAATIWGLETSAAATGTGTLYNFTWSDMSANPHATDENAASSEDWANGYKVFNDMDIEQFED